MSYVLAVYEYKDEFYGGIWDSWKDYYNDTFSPEYETIFCYDFTTKGTTYKDRKSYVENFAVDWSNVMGLVKYDWSYGELAIIESGFRRLGKQYGLLKEFAANCIC